MSFAAARDEIEHGMWSDDMVAYGETTSPPPVPFFRYPGFADTPALDAWLASRNVAVFGTDVWAYDWLDLSPTQELEILMRALNRAKRGIILLHDTRLSTAQMLPALLRALKAGDYKVVHIVPGSGRSETSPAPRGWTSTTEPIIAQVFARRQRALLARTHGGRRVLIARMSMASRQLMAPRPRSLPATRRPSRIH